MKLLSGPSVLLTDLYQLTMLQAYHDRGLDKTADFEFFIRDLPPSRNFLIAAGLEQVLDYLENFHFTPTELEWLATQKHFKQDFINYLTDFRFEGQVHAMPEGTIFFPNEPVLRITAPLAQAQIVETRIINLLHYQTMIASKAVRSVLVAQGKLLVDFGLRRAHGAEAGLHAARASYIAGFSGTSTVLAGQLFDIPLYGTMAHSFILAHGDELEAFESFAASHPENIVLLIDTFDLMKAVEKVIILADRLKKKNIRINAVRLDSGDLVENSRNVRDALDKAGHPEINIFVTGNLDESAIKKFADVNAPIDGYGVGTLMITSADAPYLECGYKLVQFDDRPRFKRSPRKMTWPCPKQVYRHLDQQGKFDHDLIARSDEADSGTPLLKTVMRDGKRIDPDPSLAEIRSFTRAQLDQFPDKLKSLDSKNEFPVRISEALQVLVKTGQ